MPSAAPGVVETGAPSFVVLGSEAMGLGSVPTDLRFLPDGRILAVAGREMAFGDGVRWEVFRAAEGKNLLAPLVAVDRDGEIYTGTDGGIARVDLREDARWELTMVADLRRDLNLRADTFSSVAVLDDLWYWYSGNGAVVDWRPNRPAKVVAQGSALERLFGSGGEVFFSEGSSGALFRLSGAGTASRIFEGGSVSDTVSCAVPLDNGELLVGTTSAGIKVFDGRVFRPFASAGLLSTGRIVDICAMGEGFFAAAIDAVGIVFFDREGRVIQTLERTLDHRLGRLKHLRYDTGGVLWALLNDGVVRVEYPSPVSHFGPLLASGLGIVRPVRHEGHLWLLSQGRAMRGVYDANQRLEKFQDDTPPGRFLFTLADVEGQLFASNDVGIFVYELGEWKLAIAGIVNARIGFSRSTARGLPYVARGEYGFIRQTSTGYTAERFPTVGLADNYNAVVDGDGIVWLELGSRRVGRFDPRAEPATFEILDAQAGLTQGWPEIYTFEGVARVNLAGTHVRFDAATKRFVRDVDLIERFPQLRSIAGRPLVDSLGRFWYSANGRIQMIPKGSTVPQEVPSGHAVGEFIVEENGIVWLNENRRFDRLDLRIAPRAPRPLRALITSVQFSATNRWLFRPAEKIPAIAYEDHSLVVNFAAPSNPFAAPVRFEVQLEGVDAQWVSTGTVGAARYNRLKEGDYRFRVRPIGAADQPGTEAHLEFAIRPPWYRTQLAWLLYAAATLGVFGLSIWFPSFLQRREKARLERLVAARTGELNTSNLQLNRQIFETIQKSTALAASEEKFRKLNAELEARVQQRTAELSLSNVELQHRESLFRLIFEHAPVGISWKRADLGGSDHLNATFKRILELNDPEIVHTPLTALIHAEEADHYAELNAQIQSGLRDNYNLEARFELANGRMVWGSLSVAVIRDAAGKIVQDIGILEDITARKNAEGELAKTYKSLVDASRLAGMAEVATGVLHNVGNVLNSLNVSANIVTEAMRTSKVDGLVKLAILLNDHADDLGTFLTQNPKGKLVPGYLTNLAEHSVQDRDRLLQEVSSMQKNIDHIKEIIARQQGHASATGVVQEISAVELFEDALRMNRAELSGDDVVIVREFEAAPRLQVEKGKVLQILVNLIRNAKHACDDASKDQREPKTIVLRVEITGTARVRLIVRDNGIGIPPENLTRIFVHGFTTRSYGHGFGLHSSALAAKEMKGTLTVASAGPQQGAVFTLELPLEAVEIGREFPGTKTSRRVVPV